MMYDAHSAKLLRLTDWRRHGAIKNPPSSLRQWGRGLNETELAALGQARMAAASAPQGNALFWQFHPQDQRAHLLCRADVIAAGGWEIHILGEDQQPTGWILKADRGAQLHCACDCEWRPDCPGVVSVPSPASGVDDKRWAAPAVHDAPVSQETASVPDGWRWPSSAPVTAYAGEADRGELHAQQEAHHEYQPSPALPAPQSLPPRRGFFAALFGGATATGTVAESAAPSVPAEWRWPEPASGSQYRGELHEPESAALSWPAVESPQWSTFDAPAMEHYAPSWGAPELPAPDAPMIGWDAPSTVWSDPEPAYAVLPASKPLSTQAEIDSFIEVAWETAPAIELEAPSDLQWLPAPEVTETGDGGDDER